MSSQGVKRKRVVLQEDEDVVGQAVKRKRATPQDFEERYAKAMSSLEDLGGEEVDFQSVIDQVDLPEHSSTHIPDLSTSERTNCVLKVSCESVR